MYIDAPAEKLKAAVPDDLESFIQALYDPEDPVLVRHIETWTEAGRKQSKVHQSKHLYPGRLLDPDAWRRLCTQAGNTRSNQFFGVCPRFAADEGYDYACQVRTVRCLWSDCDALRPEEAAGRCMEAGLPSPSILVASGRPASAHLYWLLEEPVTIDDAVDPGPMHKRYEEVGGKWKAAFYRMDPGVGHEVRVDPGALLSPKALHVQAVLAGIAARIDGDHTTDLARLLRLPCTMNRKDARNGRKPRPCSVYEMDASRRYPFTLFEPFATAFTAGRAGRATATGAVAAAKVAAAGDAAVPFADLDPARQERLEQLVRQCGEAPLGRRSGADFAAAAFAAECGLDVDEFRQFAEGVGKFAERGNDYLDRTWDKAVAKLARSRELFGGDPAPDSPSARSRDWARPLPDVPVEDAEGPATKECPHAVAASGGGTACRSGDGPPILSADNPWRAAGLHLADSWHDDRGSLLRHHRQQWHEYTGTAWRALGDEHVRGRLWRWLASCRTVVEKGRGGDRTRELARFRPNTAKVNNVLDALRAQSQTPPGVEAPCWLDGRGGPAPADVIAFRNGLLDVRAWLRGGDALLPHTPDWFSPNCLPHDCDPAAACPLWFKFLGEVSEDDGEWIDALAQWFGYLLTPDTSQQKMALLVGMPRSGKGTIARILTALLGEANVAAMSLALLGHQFGLSALAGKPAAVFGDAHVTRDGGGAVAILEKLKSIVGEDRVTVNPKNRDLYYAKLPTRFTILVNTLPRLPDASAALRSRLVLFPFKVSFEGREDLDLEGKLRAELPGVTLWALEGLRRLRGRGRLPQPQAATQALRQFTRLSSPVLGFVEDCCEVAEDARVLTADLRAAWSLWCDEMGHHAGSQEWLGVNLTAVAPRVEHRRLRTGVDPRSGREIRQYHYTGIDLNAEAKRRLEEARRRR